MPQVTYVVPDGSAHVVDVPAGQSVMDGSVRNNLPGIVAECGGSCSCATCHVHLDREFASQFAEATDEERDLLEFAEDVDERSRLSCQLILTAECDGVRVSVPASNG
ncbi:MULTISPECIES: 2Fe-2S iron-sulfur cluster-binding protein [unclassified Pseudonocardia]|uniref:2Fe-2S iron-sulfur cluster-binding protein n=1 Tax=unclassified Pseudonocardia TaxID=2619320 RepID=UPI0001FFEA1E|nr:2Fe-2S iron-sulfur cluster-binding protein [Pseudonocardia sp. Ae707_Ps1]OLM08889.1 Ferredoxin, 2Fe-2S [Pseudonocardia sp. Ae707_Ps1]OLM09285.1 Ferredoxin, 2Fe-2S [Pseudonocardia sp. Ae707_Ps1]